MLVSLFPQLLSKSTAGNVATTLTFIDSVGNRLPAGTKANVVLISSNEVVASGYLADSGNLVPDAAISTVNTLWSLSGDFYISAIAGPNTASAFVLKGTGTASGSNQALSNIFAVQPGQTYTIGGYVDPSNITSGSAQIVAYDLSGHTVQDTINIPNGIPGIYTQDWVCPDGLYQATFAFSSNNCTVAKGANLVCSEPMLFAETGTVGFNSTTLNSGLGYYATFEGGWGPTSSIQSAQFTGNTQTVSVPTYISPSLDASGYANAAIELLPNGWFSETATVSGGNLYNLMNGLTTGLELIDAQNQTIYSSLRPQSCIGVRLDSWVQDYYGITLPRFPGESDPAYYTRVQANLAARKGTVQGITAVAQAYGSVIVTEPWQVIQSGAYDTDGTIGYDAAGMYGDQHPLIECWVTPSSTLSAQQRTQLTSTVLGARPAGVLTNMYTVDGSHNATQL